MINDFYRFILSIDDFDNSVSSIFSVKFNWESGKSMARLVLGYGIYEGGG